MAQFKVALGAVFEIESSPSTMRVIAFDDVEVMYDLWWPHENAWTLAKLRDCTYYRLPRAYVEANARHIRIDPHSEKEQQVHRPDLPFAVAQHSGASWYDATWQDGLFKTTPILALGALYLAPFGPRDSAKRPVLVTADNGASFTEIELLTKAMELQLPLIGTVRLTDGVGIYRDGIKKRTPSYYLWGSKSRADAPSRVLSHATRLA